MTRSIWLVIAEELDEHGNRTGVYLHRCFRTKQQAEEFLDMLMLEARIRIADAEEANDPPEDDPPPYVGPDLDDLPF